MCIYTHAHTCMPGMGHTFEFLATLGSYKTLSLKKKEKEFSSSLIRPRFEGRHMVFSDVTLKRSQLEEDCGDIMCAFESGKGLEHEPETWASSH